MAEKKESESVEPDPNDPMVSEKSAQLLNEQSEKAAAMDEIWAEAKPNEEDEG
jgi:hypothetical protein